MCQQISPGLHGREIAARHRHGGQAAQMLALKVVHPQTLAAPQRAVLAHADPVQRQGDGVATVERPAVFGKAGRGMRVMMQYGIDRQRLLLCPVPGVIARMGIAHQPLWLKGVDLLHQRQC